MNTKDKWDKEINRSRIQGNLFYFFGIGGLSFLFITTLYKISASYEERTFVFHAFECTLLGSFIIMGSLQLLYCRLLRRLKEAFEKLEKTEI